MLNEKINNLLEISRKIFEYNQNKILKFLDWFYLKIEIHFLEEKIYKWKISQFSIFMCNLWENIWAEISKKRPVLILSSTWYSSVWDDILVVWITDLYDEKWRKKKIYEFDIVLKNYKNFWLEKESLARLSTIRQIDKKRLLYRMWKIKDKQIKLKIKEKFYNLFKF